MKLIVKNTFRDKNDHVTVYQPGAIVEIAEEERAADLIRRGLAEKVEKTGSPEKTESPESPEKSENSKKTKGTKDTGKSGKKK